MIKKNSQYYFLILLLSFSSLFAQEWKYPSIDRIRDDVIISYDVVYERELTENEKKSSSFVKEIAVSFNKNKLIKRQFYNSIKMQRFSLFDYTLKKVYSCTTIGTSKSAIVSNFSVPKKEVVIQKGKKKDVIGFSCDMGIVMLKGKPYEIYATTQLGLRFVNQYNIGGFLLEYPGYDKRLGVYKVIAKQVRYYKLPASIYSLDGFKIQTIEEFKGSLNASKERSNKYKEDALNMIGKISPSFKSRTLENKKVVSKDLLGKVVVLNFWFTTCGPCKAEIPKLNELKLKFKNKNVEFIAFALDEDYKIDTFLKRNNFEYDIVPDSRWLASKFDVKAYPTNIIIDKEGKIQFFEVGYKTDIVEKMTYKIEKILKNN